MLELRVLGSVELVRPDGVEVRSVLAQPKRTALLVYLAVDRPGQFQSRDTLLATFWPEREPERARNALNQSLHFLRRSLGPGVLETRGREDVRIDRDELDCDAVAFREALAEEDRERALELYRGDLLEGFHVSGAPGFERWRDRERARLRQAARDAAVELATEAEAPEEARRWLKRALEIVPTDERVVRRLMALLDEAGDRAGALRAYGALVTGLERSIGTNPSPETKGLAREIRERRRRTEGAGESPVAADADRSGEEIPQTERTPRSGPTASSPPPAAPGRRRWPVYAAAALLLAVSGLMLSAGDFGSDASVSGPDLPARSTAPGAEGDGAPDRGTVAVLPFDDLSPGADDDHFSDGLAEELLHRLARSSDLRVVARTSSFRFGGAGLDVRAIGDSLGAGTVLEGSVRRSGDRMRITVQLIDARDGHHLWSGSYDLRLEPDDLFAAQEQIATAIADTLQARLDAGPGRPRAELPTSDLEAYSLYLRGRRAWTERTPEGFRRAVELYGAALDRDSAFAPAWAGLGQLYVLVVTSPNVTSSSSDFVSAGEARRRARAAVDRALALDPGLAEAHTARGQLLRIQGDEEGAEEAFRRAIALNPSSPTARQWLAFLLGTRGRTDSALEQMRTAHLLDPFSVSINGDLGRFLYYAGEHERAIRRLRRTLERGPYPQADRFLALALSAAGRHDEARRQAASLDPDMHDRDRVRTIRAVVAARADRPEEARKILTRRKSSLAAGAAGQTAGDADRATVLDIARIHAALGEADSATAWLERIDEWGAGAWLQLRNDPVFAAVDLPAVSGPPGSGRDT